jgi:hypothetical protein
MLPQALDVRTAWGLAYKSSFACAKNRMRTGFWNRDKHELSLIGTGGHVPAPAMGTQAPWPIRAPVGRHAEKPVIFYQIIERYFRSCLRSNYTRAAPSRGRDGVGAGSPERPA